MGGSVSAQQLDTSSALRAVRQQLKTGASTEQILTNPLWNFLHANTTFRDYIKQFTIKSNLQIIGPAESGKKITVTGLVKDDNGKPVKNAMVYCYQTDNKGFYAFDTTHVFGNEGDRRHARLFGYMITNAEGKFVLHSIHPVGYPKSALPSHIHCEITAAGYRTMITELLFDEDERLTQDQRKRSLLEGFIISRASEGNYEYQIKLNRHSR
jgi:protocatechuate 3,4-dioxygenase beta subunit